MNGGHVSQLIRLYMTPADLRRIADEMERVWNQAPLGGDLDVVEPWSLGGNQGEVHFVVDQDRMVRRRAAGGGQ